MTGRRLAAVLALMLAPAGDVFAVGPPAVRRDRYGDPLPRGGVARLGSARLRHLSVVALAVSPDGKKVASLGDDLRLWDRASGERLAVFDHGEWIRRGVAFAPDGKHLLTAHYRSVLIWDIQTGRRRSLWKDDSRGLPQLFAFSRDGKTLAALCLLRENRRDVARVHLHDFPSGKERGVITLVGLTPFPWPAGMGFDPKGRLVLAVEDELHVWDTAWREEIRRIGVEARITSFALSPDGKTAAVLVGRPGPGEVRLLDVGPGRVKATGVKGPLRSSLAFSGDGKEVLFADREGAVVALDAKTGKQRRVVVPADKTWRTNVAAFSDDGRWLVRSNEQTIRIHDTRTGKQPTGFDDHRDGGGVEAIPSPDGRSVATRHANELRIWDLQSGKELRRIAGQGLVSGLRWSADGKQLAVGRPGKFAWYDAVSGRLVREIALPVGEAREARLVAGGRQVFATIFNPRDSEATPYLLTAADGKVVKRFRPGEWGHFCGLADDGHALWHGWGDRTTTYRVEATPERRLIWDRAPGDYSPEARLFPAGRLVILTAGGRVETRDMTRGRQTGVAHNTRLYAGWRPRALAMSADGRTLVLALMHSTPSGPPGARGNSYTSFSHVRLVEVASGQVRAELPLLPKITGAELTRDGRHLVTASADGTALVWGPGALAGRTTRARARDDLASADARSAFGAVHSLVASPRRAVGLLAERLPADGIDPWQVREWIDDIDSESFARRSEAERRLSALGEQVEEDLRAALAEAPPLEPRLRLERLLKRIETGAPETLWRGRAIEVLERVGSGEAVRLLQRLAQGHRGSRTTREAREALARLRR